MAWIALLQFARTHLRPQAGRGVGGPRNDGNARDGDRGNTRGSRETRTALADQVSELLDDGDIKRAVRLIDSSGRIPTVTPMAPHNPETLAALRLLHPPRQQTGTFIPRRDTSAQGHIACPHRQDTIRRHPSGRH